MGRLLKDLGLRTLSLLIEFIAVTVVQLFSMNTASALSTTSLIFIQGYVVNMKIQRII